ncbi:glycoside hydrolase family 5 protein [Massilia sp. Root335]|uniref:glycoside hydrolase family 5 protein n=1 Tax=Massilia sp. Root335 TaxID=1736517 RepID=UPI001911043F|nr:glycoside hydrolase family 5 protein [Massilia sp. Root335]
MRSLPMPYAALFAVLLAGCGGARGGSAPSIAAPVQATAPATAATPAPTASPYPSYNTSPVPPDTTGMSHNARQIAASIRIGWNVGNTMEATGGETAWGNPQVSNALIQAVKKAGFNAIRLPVSWDQYADQKTGRISAAWLARVKQVVQYCVDNDMYVLVNIHWDGGWLEKNVTPDKKDAVNAKQKAYWEQIATALRGFDEHVMFASANEPDAKDATAMAVLMSYHQTFVDAVRATGGRNAYRVLVVQGPQTNIDLTVKLMPTLPADKVPGRMMAEIHFYDPFNFVLMDKDATWGYQAYYWGAPNHSTTDTIRNPTWGEEAYVDAQFASLKTQFVGKGIPVLLGEFAAMRRTNLTGAALALHLKSRNYYHTYVVRKAVANGVVPFFWDVGAPDDRSGGIFDRTTNLVRGQQTLDALMAGLTAK